MKTNLTILLLLITLISSCKKDSPDSSATATSFKTDSGGVFISNEGNFGSANASVSYFNPNSGSVIEDVYKSVTGNALGDICQSMNIINGHLFLVVNNSGKIEICNPSDISHVKTITGLTSPRYILQVSPSKAYVTDGYSNFISIINLTSNTVSGTIALNGWTEQMVLVNNTVYVTNTNSENLFVINTMTDIVSDSIHISKGANSIREDKNGKLWILCGGDYLNTYNGALYRINTANNQVEQNNGFPQGVYPGRLCMNSTNDTMYFLNTDVWRMSITDIALPATAFVVSNGNSFYGLGFDKSNNEIFVSDAIDYSQKGKVYRYKLNGTVIDNFKVGICPGDFLFL